MWTTCIAFFQVTLLAGYAYAHLSAKLLGKRQQIGVHALVLLAALAVLPIHVPAGWTPPRAQSRRVAAIVAPGCSGPPLLRIVCHRPAFARVVCSFRASLIGRPLLSLRCEQLRSLLGLLSYPFVLEPLLRLSEQSRVWAWGYRLFVLMVGASLLLAWRILHDRTSLAGMPRLSTRIESVAASNDGTPSSCLRLRWLALAFVPSSLMLGVTTALTTDIPAIPLFWVIPLALYLLSFVLVFARKSVLPACLVSRRLPSFNPCRLDPYRLKRLAALDRFVPLYSLTLFAVGLVCHGEVARSRPATRHLTDFYLWISVGGALGGTFNALLVLVIFTSVMEFPIALVSFVAVQCLLLQAR